MTSKCSATFLGLAISLGASGVAPAAETHPIDQRGRAFHPSLIAIERGDTLVINNRDDFIHQIYVKSSEMSFDSDGKLRFGANQPDPNLHFTEAVGRGTTVTVRRKTHRAEAPSVAFG